MKVRNLFGALLPLVLGSGCYSHTAAMARRPVVVAPVAPASQSSEFRVYPAVPDTAPPSTTVVPSTTKVVPAEDLEIAIGLRNSLEANPALKAAAASADIEVNGGAVTLRGSVPTEHDRRSLKELVSRYPGVHSVEDHLKVELR